MERVLVKLGPVAAADERAVKNRCGAFARAHAGLVKAILDKLVNGRMGESEGGLVCNDLLEMARKIAEGNLASVIAYQGKQDKFTVEVRQEGSYFRVVVSSGSEERRRFLAVVAATEAILKELGVRLGKE